MPSLSRPLRFENEAGCGGKVGSPRARRRRVARTQDRRSRRVLRLEEPSFNVSASDLHSCAFFPSLRPGFMRRKEKREREREGGGELKAFLHAVLKAILEKYTDGINTPRLQFRPDKYWPAYGVFFLSLSLSLSLALSISLFPCLFFFRHQ